MAGFANGLAELFMSPEDTEGLEYLRGNFARLGAAETARQAARAEKMLRGLLEVFKEDNPTLYLALSRAQSLVMEARERAEGYAGAYAPR